MSEIQRYSPHQKVEGEMVDDANGRFMFVNQHEEIISALARFRESVCESLGEHIDTEDLRILNHIDDLRKQCREPLVVLNEAVAQAIHYPECWDTANYPTMVSALAEVYASFNCSNETHAPELASMRGVSPSIDERWEEVKKIAAFAAAQDRAPTDLESALCWAVARIRELIRTLGRVEHDLFIQTASAQQLGRLVADKDNDRIFFRDKLKEAEALLAKAAVNVLPRIGFYLQDSRSYTGNDMLWWKKNGNGYTSDLREAHVFSADEAAKGTSRASDKFWPVGYINAKSRPAVDVQQTKSKEAGEWVDPTVLEFPFSAEQVKNLDEFQRAGAMHPFTCPNRGDEMHFKNGIDLGGLIATRRGWICQYCDYHQDWAHTFMLDGSALRNRKEI